METGQLGDTWEDGQDSGNIHEIQEGIMAASFILKQKSTIN